MTVKTNELSAELFLRPYTSVDWEPPGIEQVRKALENMIATFTAYDNDKAVGMVRLIGDGGMSFYIKEHINPDWAVSLELISSKEAVGFYQKHGFEERPSGWDGSGMFKMIR